MSRSLRARIELLLSGNVTRQSRKFGRDMTQMGDRGDRAMGRLQRRAEVAGASLGRLITRAGGLAGAYLGVQAIGRELTLDERLERLGVAADIPTEKMKELRAEIAATAEEDDIRIDPSQILGAIEKITEATGDFEMGRALQREIALAIQATGSGGDEIGALVASIAEKFDIRTPDGMKKALDLLAKQGKDGAIELTNLASLGPKVFAVYGSFGKKSLQGLAEAGALMQVFKRGVGGPEQAATVFENVFNALGDVKKLKQMRDLGVATTDAAGELKKPVELLKAVIEAASGDDLKLGSVFDAEAMRGVRQLSKMLRDDGGFGDLDAMIRIEADGKTLEADSARIAATASAKLESAGANLRSIAGDVLAEPIQALADALEKFDKALLQDLANGAAALAAAYVGAKVIKGGVGLASDLRHAVGPRKVGASIGGGLGSAASMAKPVPVFVTNPGFGKGLGGKTGAMGGAAAGAGGTAASAAATRKATDGAMRAAAVSEAAGNAGRRANVGAGLGVATAIGAVASAQHDMDEVFARQAELMKVDGIAKTEAFSKALDEKQDENAKAFDAWLARTMPSLFGPSKPEAVPEGKASAAAKPKPRYAPVKVPKPSAVKDSALAPFQTPASGGGTSSFVSGLIAPAAQPALPQSAPTESSERVVDAIENQTDELRELRRTTEGMSRRIDRSGGFKMSVPGESFQIMGAP